MPRKRETIATVSFKRKPDWRYGPCVDTSGELHVLGYPPFTSYLNPAKPVVVVRTGFQHLHGSDYELVGNKVVRSFDPQHEAKEVAARKLRDRGLAEVKAPAFVNAVKQLARRLGGKSSLVETDADALPALWEIRLRKRAESSILDEAQLDDAIVFARELVDDFSRVDAPERVAAIGVVPKSMAHAIPTLLACDPDGTTVAPVVAALVRDANARITICTDDVLELRLAKKCPRIDHHARALARLDSDEATLSSLKKQLAQRRVWLWWD